MEYTLSLSKRAKHLRITVHPDGRVVVTAPKRISVRFIHQFLKQKASWIHEKLLYFQKHSPVQKRTRQDYLTHKERARILVEDKIQKFNKIYQFPFKRISIRDQKTRWGSCSRQGNLNFNYKIVFLEESLADYLVVHELCHLKEFNHSSAFWHLVSKTIPEYKRIRTELKKKGLSFY